jgi:hypothetical protein
MGWEGRKWSDMWRRGTERLGTERLGTERRGTEGVEPSPVHRSEGRRWMHPEQACGGYESQPLDDARESVSSTKYHEHELTISL